MTTLPDGWDHLPPEMNVPFECTSCGSLFQLFGPEDGSDLCDCDNPTFRVFVSDAGKYAGVVEYLVDNAEGMAAEMREAYSETNRDDLGGQ